MALHAQGLASAPNGEVGQEKIYETITQIGCVQIDTLQMVRRSQYLVIWSRLGSYDTTLFDDLLSGDSDTENGRKLFEYWLHAACLIPLADYRYSLPLTRKYREGAAGWRRSWIEQPGNRALVDQVMSHIQENGPARSADFDRQGPKRGAWWDWKPAKLALEHLYNQGDLMVADRRNFQRMYDLKERVLPGWVDQDEPTETEATRHIFENSLRSLGVCEVRQVSDYTHIKRTEAKPILETLVNSGALQTGRNMWQEVRVGAPIRNFLDIVADKNYEQQPDITVDTLEEMLPQPKEGHEWKPVQVPDQSQLVTALQNKKEELLDQGFPIALLPGQPEQQRASSGYQAANEMGAAITQLDPPLRNIANADRNLFTKIHGIIKALDVSVELPVHQHGDRSTPSEVITIKPEDLGEVDLTVTYESIPEAAKFAMIEELRRQVKDGHTSKAKLMAFLHDDPFLEQDRIDREVSAAQATQMAHADSAAIVEEERGPAMRQIAAEEGFPLPAEGGPAPGETVRNQRPVGGGFPGLGAPAVPPPQTQPGQAVPADVNTAL
ncbi:MAG: YcaQ family DNA glycosylase, partial [Chloroflexi bacterium]|nr:YcaQ family DNA glycosylase [Chloroflexota bacterium]